MKNMSSVLFLAICLATTSGLYSAENAVKLPNARRAGVVIDQPAGLVMGMDSDVLGEIVERLDRTTPDLVLTVLNPREDGTLVRRRDGKTMAMTDFDTLWVYREHTMNDAPITNAPGFVAKLKAFLADPSRGVVLGAHACDLFETLGCARIRFGLLTSQIDRYQIGIVPNNPESSLFKGAVSDRGMISLTHAAFHVYTRYEVTGSDVVHYGTTREPWHIPIFAALGPGAGSSKRVSVVTFPWAVSYVYQNVEEEFRHNYETLALNLMRQAGREFDPLDTAAPAFTLPDFAPLRRALVALMETRGDEYPNGRKYLAALDALEKRAKTVKTKTDADLLAADHAALQKEALLANPELDFNELLFVRRNPKQMGFPANYNSNSSLPRNGYENELVRFNFRDGSVSTVFKPSSGEFVGDVDLHFDGQKALFSMPDAKNDYRWRVWEIPLASGTPGHAAEPKKLSTIEESDVDDYDACYLPDERVVFCSTACFTGVPCINGSGHVCNLYLRETSGKVRQLTIEQDHDWCPVVMNNGRIMYLRWEYTGLPHAYARIMFHCNPDGTNQTELYGSGSYWPGAMFFARPVPGHPTKFAAIVTGHHEQARIGDLVVFDPALGRRENEGAVQRIPGYGKKVNSVPLDYPIQASWPKFTHPFPISEDLFVVSCKRTASAPWTLCLVDTFDNIVTLREEPGLALLEPVPLRKTPRPNIVPDRIADPKKDADVFIADLYEGEGLKGVPRGTIKSLRVSSYHFSYQGMGGEPHSIGLDGPWDPQRIIGTVPVQDDGSVSFRVPANTPISFQPLDAEGKAVQLMRSWVTAMPGESLSCVGCHEKQNTTAPPRARSLAARNKPVELTPFLGAPRGLSFQREIQPVLDCYCVECHQPDSKRTQDLLAGDVRYQSGALRPDIPDFRDGPILPSGPGKSSHVKYARFTNAYMQLRRYVHTPTKESVVTVLKPYQYHADSTRLVEVLQSGHYGVKLDTDSWDRLIVWIDLNAPFHANWGDLRNYEMEKQVENQWKRRSKMRELYAAYSKALDDDPVKRLPVYPVKRDKGDDPRNVVFQDRPDPVPTASDGRKAFAKPEVERLELADGVVLELVRVPGTTYKMGRFEITNEQYQLFDPKHDSGLEQKDVNCFGPREQGYLLCRPKQPVVRVTWNDADAFCKWLSKKTGRVFTLPTAAQWRYAASAGTTTTFWFGDLAADFSRKENMADVNYGRVAYPGMLDGSSDLVEWRPADRARNDRCRVSAPVGGYEPNPWGLFDMLGNVAEWTASESTGPGGDVKKQVCGGSWATLPKDSGVSALRRFRPYVNVYDVGFRVCETVK